MTSLRDYIWEGAQVIAEYNNAAAAGSPNTEYIFTGGRMLAEERTGSGTTRFFHQDRLSIRLSTNSAGQVLGAQSHLPYGEQLTESSEQQKWKFTTYERDSETGDDYAINRGYWPTLGRFRQSDPSLGSYALQLPQSLNRHSYSINDPVNVADPLGLYSVGFIATLLGNSGYFTPAEFQYSLYLGGDFFLGINGNDIRLGHYTGPIDAKGLYKIGPDANRFWAEFYNLLEEQIAAINRVLREILGNKKCREFFEKAASAAVGRTVSLDETVRNTTFNGYDSTNKPSDFKTGGGNEIVRDQPVAATVGTAVYLNKESAFGRPGVTGFIKDYIFGQAVDLKGTVVHELFHVAGVHDAFENGKRIDTVDRDFRKGIIDNCLK